jgi:hypothetical protein
MSLPIILDSKLQNPNLNFQSPNFRCLQSSSIVEYVTDGYIYGGK